MQIFIKPTTPLGSSFTIVVNPQDNIYDMKQ
jgi:hypothetical protein